MRHWAFAVLVAVIGCTGSAPFAMADGSNMEAVRDGGETRPNRAAKAVGVRKSVGPQGLCRFDSGRPHQLDRRPRTLPHSSARHILWHIDSILAYIDGRLRTT
jgi:hypothetical protein